MFQTLNGSVNFDENVLLQMNAESCWASLISVSMVRSGLPTLHEIRKSPPLSCKPPKNTSGRYVYKKWKVSFIGGKGDRSAKPRKWKCWKLYSCTPLFCVLHNQMDNHTSFLQHTFKQSERELLRCERYFSFSTGYSYFLSWWMLGKKYEDLIWSFLYKK
jgi:hypothetical protein